MTTGVISWNIRDNPNQLAPLSVVAVALIMGLDPVKVEQHYLVLYSMYTTHMGQGKEAA